MEIRVARRVELLSILFHFAGGKDYQAFDTPYRRAVDTWFAPFINHPAVIASRELREKYGISFNAPVSLAVFLDEETLLPLVDLGKEEELDFRWRSVPLREYLEKVRAFAVDSKILDFLAQQQPYIEEVEKRLADALANEKIEEWYTAALVVDPATHFVVMPGLLTGPWNYDAAAHDDCGRRWVYQVVELEGAEKNQGLPTPTRTTTELIAHEMGHSFVNPVVERHTDVLVPAAQPLFEIVKETLAKQRYTTPSIMIEESLVRVLAVFFARDRKGPAEASRLVHNDMGHGFTWNLELCQWFAQQKSPVDLNALVPALARWFNEHAPRAHAEAGQKPPPTAAQMPQKQPAPAATPA